jgi:hypothetical protein
MTELVSTERIRAYRQKYHPAKEAEPELKAVIDDAPENVEMHDSALFDSLIVEVGFYDGRRIRIPQQSTPADWVSPF